MKIVNIALPVPADNLFTYIVPEEYENEKIIGRRALVSFGERTLTGVIVNENIEIGEKKLKRILEIFDEKQIISDTMLGFTKWISEYYMASWGETLRAALPQGMTPQSIVKVEIIRYPETSELETMSRRAPKRSALLRTLRDIAAPVSINYLESLLNSRTIAQQLEALEQMDYIKCVKIIEKDMQPKMQKALKINTKLIEDSDFLKETLDKLDKSAPKQSLLLSYLFLQHKYSAEPTLLSDALRETQTSAATADALTKKELIEISEIEIDRGKNVIESESLAQNDETEMQPTNEQTVAIEKISESIDKSEFETYLLHGITGSGKTLVYLNLISKVIDIGKTALVLVPEISLTPQLIDRFNALFPDLIAVLHSKMSDGQRYDSWRNILKGKAKIVIGARSAIFAPIQNLGLIIVDEEHDSSYKQTSPAPRYNARDCAIVRANREGCPIILGSATPSLESYYNAKSGKYKLLEIKNRADDAQMPKIRIIDTIDARKKGQFKGSFTKDLLEAIAQRVERQEGVILFQNRRGFSAYLECHDCGYIPMCENCSVSLTYHKHSDKLRCHYCGFTTNPPKTCPSCGYFELSEIGFGTQRIEDELSERLSEMNVKAVIERMDLDTTSRKGSHRRILTSFANGSTDILVGTQMVAKGLDFARVTLVGVVNADLSLYIPDFRSSERTFQILTQVSGRAGRSKEKTGEVIIQTSHPTNFSITASKSNSLDYFYNSEIRNRDLALYPPFTRFVMIEFSGKDEHSVLTNALRFRELLHESNGIVIMGPVAPSIARLRGNFRRIIIIKDLKKVDPSGSMLRQKLKTALDEYKQKFAASSVRLILDIDSYSGV